MIKNVMIKKVLKKTVFKIISIINKIIPKKDNYILLYSANKGIDFNLKPLKKYLLENEYQKNNKIICGIENMKYKENDVCKYITHIKSIYYFLRSKHIFYTAGQLPIKPSKSQCVLHLQHGTTFKACAGLTKINNGDEIFFTACMATSDIYKKIYSKAFNCLESNVYVNSEPITDIFYQNYQRYDFKSFDKIILWAPTFRQSDYLGYSDSTKEELLPLFKEEEYKSLNEKLKQLNFKLIVKIHPSQDLSKYKQLFFSNLEIMSNKDFEKEGYELYNLLPQIDVLIADYSSLFLQFLLLNKPIGFVIPDYDEYSKKRGFAFKDPLEYMPGEKIYTQNQFYSFLDDCKNNNDKWERERQKIKNIIHKYDDGLSCERLIKISNIKK